MKIYLIRDKEEFGMRKKSTILIVIMILLTFNACQSLPSNQKDGKHTSNSYEDNIGGEGEKKMELTQRQQEILKQAGLPTNYEQLDDNQKKSIVAIEEMFTYLDKKYETSFEYVGYRAASNVDKETLIVQPDGGTSADNVSVIREDGKCSDNYATVYYREAYELMVKTYVEAKFTHVEVFSDIEEIENVSDQEDLRPNVSATSGIYIAESDMEGKNLNDVATEFAQWYASGSNGRSCSFALYVVPDETYWSITRFNRTNYNDKVITKVNAMIRTDGSVVIR